MKKMFCILGLLFSMNVVFALPDSYEIMQDNSQLFYSPSNDVWASSQIYDDSIVLNKKLYEGTGAYSVYNYFDGSLAFALATGDEFIYDGKFVIVDNNLLKFSKIIYNGSVFEIVAMEYEEILEIFPDIEIIKVSWIDDDNVMWIHKPFLEKKTILLFNDTERFFHGLMCKSKYSQDDVLKGLITFSRYGIYRFKHYGMRDGKLTFLIR